jgi:Tfp pilus assembly protein PilV
MKATFHHQQTSQRGAALIAVLVILVVITLLGVTAMRMGITSLALATNSQVVQVLFQSADLGTSSAINTFNEDPEKALDAAGLFGGTSGSNCLTPINTAQFTNFSSGDCNAKNAASYLSERKVTLTQVNYRVLPIAALDASNAQKDLSDNDESSENLAEGYDVQLYSTAVIPSFGSADPSDINTCLAKEPDDQEDKTIETITDCLTNAGSVFTTHASEYKVKRNF